MTLSQLQNKIKQVFEDTVASSGSIISKALLSTAKNHVQERFPGSSHWNPNKITEGENSGNQSSAFGSININIPGAGRAYHDVVIRPVTKRHLAIPIHATAYGKKPADFNHLFKIPGKNVLAMKKGTGIVALFALAKKAFQKQDKTLLPTDETFADNIIDRFVKVLDDKLDSSIQ